MKRLSHHWLRYLFALFAHYSGLDVLYRRAAGAGLVVVMLHRLRDEHDPFPLSTSRASFGQLVRWLRERRALVGLEEGLGMLEGARSSHVNYAITFDDGYRDNLGVLDTQLGAVPAIVYVATAHVGGEPIWVYRLHHAIAARTHDDLDLDALGLGRFDLSDAQQRQRLYDLLPPRLKQLEPEAVDTWVDAVIAQTRPTPRLPQESEMLDWHEIDALHARGILIGAHTRRHVLLSRVDDDAARAEIQGSRNEIAARLGAAPAHFAYPNGSAADFGERDVRLVREAGFRTAVTSIEGINRRGTDPYRILRYNVHEARYRAPSGHLSQALFFSETSGLLGWLRSRRAA